MIVGKERESVGELLDFIRAGSGVGRILRADVDVAVG
jgi:hypothetical protein